MDKLCYQPSTLRMIKYIKEHGLEDRVILRGPTAADYLGIVNLDYLDKENNNLLLYFSNLRKSGKMGACAYVFLRRVDKQDDYLWSMFGKVVSKMERVGWLNVLRHSFQTTIITDRVQFVMNAIWVNDTDIDKLGVETIDGIKTINDISVYKELLTKEARKEGSSYMVLVEALAVYYATHGRSFGKLKYILDNDQLRALESAKIDVESFYKNVIE